MIQYFPVRFKAEPLSKLYPGTVPLSLLIYLWEFILAVLGCLKWTISLADVENQSEGAFKN